MREMTEAVSAAKFAIRRMQTLPLSGCATASAARNRRERLSRSSSAFQNRLCRFRDDSRRFMTRVIAVNRLTETSALNAVRPSSRTSL